MKQHSFVAASGARRAGFTLVEILVVLGIIAVLAALLFPAFARSQEGGRQKHCASNLAQIAVAVRQYYEDEKYYPSSIAFLMPEDALGGSPNDKSAAYLSSEDIGRCPDDDNETKPHSSYGFFGLTTPPALPALAGGNPYTSAPPADPSLYVWNYWGYRADGYAYQSAEEAAVPYNTTFTWLVDKTRPYNHPNAPATYNPVIPKNVVEYSLSNRYAPRKTIIAHCVYHRLPTANDLNQPAELYYSTDPTAGNNTRDLIVLLSGDVRTLDVSSWPANTPTPPKVSWQNHMF